jgi:hypothetical protein
MKLGRYHIGKPELAAAFGLIVYTFGRFLAAGGTMSEYGVDARWFLFWDAAPIPAYVWAIGRLVRGLAGEGMSIGQMLSASTVAILAFMSPYIYLFYAGAKEFPPSAWILLILVIVLLAANAVRDVRNRVRRTRDERTVGDDDMSDLPLTASDARQVIAENP